jgi:hypothetical protein
MQPDRTFSPVALSSNSALKSTKCQKQVRIRALLVLLAVAVAWSPALAQSVSLSPTSMSFGSQVVGTTSASQAVTLSNTGGAAFGITSIAASTQFGQTNNCPISPSTLAVNASCAINVTFTPTAAGTQSGSITIAYSAVGSPQQISLTGTGTANVAPAVSLSASSLAFASPAVKVVQDSSAMGSGSATLAAAFGGNVTQNNLMVVGVSSYAGNTFASPAISDTLGSIWSLAVAQNPGTAGTPAQSNIYYAVVPSTGLDTVTVHMTGTNSLHLHIYEISGLVTSSVLDQIGSNFQPSDTAATVSTSGPTTMANEFLFAYFARDNGSGTWTASSGYGNTLSSPNSGSGTDAFSEVKIISAAGTQTATATSSATDGFTSVIATFVAANGGTPVGTTSAAQTLTLNNTGTALLSITSIVASGDYRQTNTCGSFVAVGATCTISVTFTPTATGTRNGAIAVIDNAAGSPQTVPLLGTGNPTVMLSPSSLSFSSQPAGTTSTAQLVTLTNSFSTTVAITGIAAAGDFDETNTCGTSVPAGGTCNISVAFKPSATGSRMGTLTVTDSAGNSPQVASLSGTGSAPILVSLAVAPAAPSIMWGNSQQFTATGTFSDGSTQNLTTSVSWSSSATSVAAISNVSGNQGLAGSIAFGWTTIAASSGSIMNSTILTVDQPPPPIISGISPASGATVSGTITVSTSVTDSIGITKVEFYLDGGLQTTAISSPYNWTWRTASASNTNHTILVKAYDPASNSTTASETLIVNNSGSSGGGVLTPSGPISLSGQNGVVVQNLHITNPNGDCVSISNSMNITIRQSEIGPCKGNGIVITNGNTINVFDNYIHPEGTLAGCCDVTDGIFSKGTQNLTVQGNVVAYGEANIEAQNQTGLNIIGNFFLNPRGRANSRGQNVQVYYGSSNVLVRNNYALASTDITKYGFAEDQEDSMNFGGDPSAGPTTGIVAQNNYITGGRSVSGCGLTADTAANDAQFLNNTLVNTGQCGIGIADGTNQVVQGNKILNATPVNGGGNAALYVWKVHSSDPVCGPVQISNNVASAIATDGSANSFWDGGGCDPVTMTNNTFDAAAQQALSPASQTLPPPPIPPQPAKCAIASPFTTSTALPDCGSSVTTAPFGHVFIVVEENSNYSSVIGNSSMPYLNSLANEYGLATQYYADTHPSISNYLMLTTGQIITKDDSQTPLTLPVSADNVVRELIASGKTWKQYAESIPSVGYLGNDSICCGGQYYTRHVPLPYMTDAQVAGQLTNIVPFTQFATDLANNALPNYGFITPNGCNDAHDCGLNVADNWLKANIDPLIKSPLFQSDGLLIIVFDESASDNSNGGGQVAAVIVSPFGKGGYKSTTIYQHESVLRLMLEGLGVKVLPGAAATAPKMWEFFTFTPPS